MWPALSGMARRPPMGVLLARAVAMLSMSSRHPRGVPRRLRLARSLALLRSGRGPGVRGEPRRQAGRVRPLGRAHGPGTGLYRLGCGGPRRGGRSVNARRVRRGPGGSSSCASHSPAFSTAFPRRAGGASSELVCSTSQMRSSRRRASLCQLLGGRRATYGRLAVFFFYRVTVRPKCYLTIVNVQAVTESTHSAEEPPPCSLCSALRGAGCIARPAVSRATAAAVLRTGACSATARAVRSARDGASEGVSHTTLHRHATLHRCAGRLVENATLPRAIVCELGWGSPAFVCAVDAPPCVRIEQCCCMSTPGRVGAKRDAASHARMV